MEVNTKPFGVVDVDERQRIHFPFGILGFEQLKWYVLLDASQAPFYWLQSLDDPQIAFVLIDPLVFRPDYELEVLDEELQEIDIQEKDETLVFAIVTIPENQERMSANLQGPLVINRRAKLGRQLISLNPFWKVKHFILEELARVKDEAC